MKVFFYANILSLYVHTKPITNGIVVALICCSHCVVAQSGFRYVDLPSDATQNALGGQVISLINSQPLSFLQNPALIDSSQNKKIGVNLSPMLGQGLYTAVAFVKQQANNSNWAVGFRGITYGEFTGLDALGNPTENFGAGSFLLTAAYAKKRQYITFGIAAKVVSSFIETYNSTALLVDIGGTFKHPTKDLSIGLAARNLGVSLSRFTDAQQQLPFDMLLGISFKPQYMPVRFTFNADQLFRLNTLEESTNNQAFTNSQQVFGHLSGGAEFLLHPKITPILGFNYRANQTLFIGDSNRFGGFAYGLRFQHKKVLIAASRTNYLPQIGQWVFSSCFGI